MKRFLSLCFAFMMVLTVVPMLAGAEALEGSEYCVTADMDMSAPVAPEDNPWSGFDTSEPVHLVFYVVGHSNGEDHQMVIDLVNQRMQQLINTTIEVPIIPLSDFQTKYPLVLAGGTDCDIIMTHPMIGPFATNADNGAYYELTWDFLEKWMPETVKSQAPESWKQAMYKGKLFQIPRNEADYEQAYGVLVLKALREKYSIPEITDLATFVQYLEAVAAGEKDTGIFPLYANPTCPLQLIFCTNMESFQQVTGYFYWDADNAQLAAEDTFILQFSDEYTKYCLQMADWAKKGFWPANAITNVTHINDLFKTGKSAADINMYKKANESILYLQNLGIEAEYFNIMPKTATTRKSIYSNDALAITSFTKYPERAALAIDVMKNDPYINNLLQGGIEGVHYILEPGFTRSEGPRAEQYPWSGWAWCLRSQFNPRPGGITPTVQKAYDQYDAMELDPARFPIDGFSFDNTGYEDISAAVTALVTEWYPSFDLGLFGDNTEAKLAEYRGLLEAAGVKELFAEFQSQLAAFLAAK